MAPMVSQLVDEEIITPKSVTQLDAYSAGVAFAKTEGIIPAPETNHVISLVMEEALKAKEEGKEKVILFNFSGHGLIDLVGYDKYLSNELTNFALSEEEMAAAEKVFENFPKPGRLKSR
jgi:tryptophan synthase beta chain